MTMTIMTTMTITMTTMTKFPRLTRAQLNNFETLRDVNNARVIRELLL